MKLNIPQLTLAKLAQLGRHESVSHIISFSGGRGNCDANQSHLILNLTEELHMRPYMVTKRRCAGTKHFHWVISCSFHNFHNVSIYAK